MGKLTIGTQNNYRVQLRKLRKLLPLLPDDHSEKGKVLAKIERLTNQLGMEMNDLEIMLARRPGRPRTEPQVAEELAALGAIETPTRLETKEEREEKHRQRQAELKAKIEQTDPTYEGLKESEQALKEMLELANDKLSGENNEGHKQDADDVGTVGGDNRIPTEH